MIITSVARMVFESMTSSLKGSLDRPHPSAPIHICRVSTHSIPSSSMRVRISSRRGYPSGYPNSRLQWVTAGASKPGRAHRRPVENDGVKHAGPAALVRLDSVLRQVRELDALRERKRGSFDSRFGVTLHFHEDPTGLYADLRSAGKTERHRVTTVAERAAVVRLLRAALRAHDKL